jgi:hypothetical protein
MTFGYKGLAPAKKEHLANNFAGPNPRFVNANGCRQFVKTATLAENEASLRSIEQDLGRGWVPL